MFRGSESYIYIPGHEEGPVHIQEYKEKSNCTLVDPELLSASRKCGLSVLFILSAEVTSPLTYAPSARLGDLRILGV